MLCNTFVFSPLLKRLIKVHLDTTYIYNAFNFHSRTSSLLEVDNNNQSIQYVTALPCNASLPGLTLKNTNTYTQCTGPPSYRY
jgi:hypothetical protein